MRLLNKFFKEANKKEAISWAFYDFANSSYALLILSFVFPIYFKEVVAGAEKGDFYWGVLVSVSILIGGLLAPIIGAIADYDARKKIKFIIFALVSMIGTSFLFIKERSENRNRESLSTLIKHGIKSVIGTMKNLKQHKNIAWFLVGFYFVNDALVTIFAFTPIYARTTFGMEFKEILTLLLIVQIVAFPAATIF